MSSRLEPFECSWSASPTLLRLHALVAVVALVSLWLAALPWTLAALLTLLVLWSWHRVRYRQLQQGHPEIPRRLRHAAEGWQLWSPARGWRGVQLRPDSLALPLLVVLRYRLSGERRTRSLCIARDSLSAAAHRRLRVRLRFAPRRFAVPE
ncbi:protein YgfX [Pseudomonas oryzihabitans]|uniref:protein YgfX n=1 Tax=Pseudomonas oryzihabitans TaxID=47885 RepID=UPI002864363E|nr:protein YgfX [Pseudomonas psychrotolerans]MDR6678326.1 toxin CptA [Pseudomonas psychrotolerans]